MASPLTKPPANLQREHGNGLNATQKRFADGMAIFNPEDSPEVVSTICRHADYRPRQRRSGYGRNFVSIPVSGGFAFEPATC
jgi:hypothetical protein